MKFFSNQIGFTLIEFTIALTLLVLFLTMAYHNFKPQILKTRRYEAMATLLEMQLQLEKNYHREGQYRDLSSLPSSQHYHYSIPHLKKNAYLLQATAIHQKNLDTQCKQLTLDNTGKKSPAHCWQ